MPIVGEGKFWFCVVGTETNDAARRCIAKKKIRRLLGSFDFKTTSGHRPFLCADRPAHRQKSACRRESFGGNGPRRRQTKTTQSTKPSLNAPTRARTTTTTKRSRRRRSSFRLLLLVPPGQLLPDRRPRHVTKTPNHIESIHPSIPSSFLLSTIEQEQIAY